MNPNRTHKPTETGIIVQKIQMLGIPQTVYRYEAYEPSSIMGPHATITHINGKCYGKVSTRRFESDLPRGYDRLLAAQAHYATAKAVAEAAILEAHPEAGRGRRDGMGSFYVDG